MCVCMCVQPKYVCMYVCINKAILQVLNRTLMLFDVHAMFYTISDKACHESNERT